VIIVPHDEIQIMYSDVFPLDVI